MIYLIFFIKAHWYAIFWLRV